VDSHLGLGRAFKNMMIVEHDNNMFGNRQPPNRCLLGMIGPRAAH
jgi:hypothetical protein